MRNFPFLSTLPSTATRDPFLVQRFEYRNYLIHATVKKKKKKKKFPHYSQLIFKQYLEDAFLLAL